MNSRAKGQRAERHVCKLLDAWWKQYNPDAEFRRTPLSGGSMYAEKFNSAADICCSDPEFCFAVEVKHRNNWSKPAFDKSFVKPLNDRTGEVWRWWDQTLAQARAAAKLPLLFFRANRTPWSVMLDVTQTLREPYYVSADSFLASDPLGWLNMWKERNGNRTL